MQVSKQKSLRFGCHRGSVEGLRQIESKQITQCGSIMHHEEKRRAGGYRMAGGRAGCAHVDAVVRQAFLTRPLSGPVRRLIILVPLTDSVRYCSPSNPSMWLHVSARNAPDPWRSENSKSCTRRPPRCGNNAPLPRGWSTLPALSQRRSYPARPEAPWGNQDGTALPALQRGQEPPAGPPPHRPARTPPGGILLNGIKGKVLPNF